MMTDYIWGRLAMAVFAGICAYQDMKTMSVNIRTLAAGFVMVLLGTLIIMWMIATSGISSVHGTLLISEASTAFSVPAEAASTRSVMSGASTALAETMMTYAQRTLPHMALGECAIIAARATLGCLPGAVLLGLSRWTGQIGEGDGLYFMIMGAAMGAGRVAMLLMATLFLHSAVCGIYLLTAGGHGMLRRRMPLLPAAGAAYILIFAIGR